MSRARLIFSASLIILCIASVVSAFSVGGFVRPSSAYAAKVGVYATQRQIHFYNMKTSQIPSQSSSGPVTYQGGRVMQSTSTTYAIFWEPPKLPDGKQTHVSPTYNSLLRRYFGDVGGSGLYNNNTQYYDNFTGHIKNSSTSGGSWVDTSPYPKSDCTDPATPHGCMIDADIQTEVKKAMSTTGWTGGLTHLFFVFTSWGEGSCADSSSTQCALTSSGGYCAYHSNFNNNGTVLYANIPYVGTVQNGCLVPDSPNNDMDADRAIDSTNHEHMEAVTDPLGTAWQDANHQEVSDKCADQFGPTPFPFDNGLANVQWNGHNYIVAEKWSNYRNTVIGNGGCTLAESGALLIGSAYISPMASNNQVNVMAFNTSDGTSRWSFPLPNNGYIEGAPIMANGLLYVSAGNNVYAINPTTGAQSRDFATGGQLNASPDVVNGVVYICSTDQYVYAYNAKNGSLLWKYQTSAVNELSPRVVNNVVYFGANNGYLYALNASNGTLLWSVAGPSGFYSKPTVVSGVVYIGTLYGVDAFNATNGTLLWDYQVAGTGTARESVSFPPTVVNGVVYAGSTGLNGSGGHIIALNASNGTVIWPPYPTGTNPGIVSQPIVSAGTIYAGADGVYALDANTGTLRWHQQTSFDFSTPTLVNGVIIINSNAGMFALRATTGSVYWSNIFCCNDSSVSSPTVSLVGY